MSMISLYAKRNESGSYNKVSCLKQGSEMSNYCLKQGQVLKTSAADILWGVLSIYLIGTNFAGLSFCVFRDCKKIAN